MSRIWRMGLIGLVILGLCGVGLSQARQPKPSSHRDPGSRHIQLAVQQPNPSKAAAERILELSLPDAVRLAVQNNLDIERQRYEPRIARTEVARERAAFDPTVGLDASISQTKILPESQVITIDENGVAGPPLILLPFSKNGEVTPLFKQKIITGGNYELRFVNTRENTSPASSGTRFALEDPRYESSLDLTLTQPLLRDFGIAVNSAPIRRAQNTEAIAHQRVIQSILDVVFQVQDGYWNLVFQIEDLAAKKESQKLAEDFLAENKIRVELGTLAPIELVQAETQVKIREEEVILAEASVQDAEDQLKQILNIPRIMGTWQLRIHPTDKPAYSPASTLVLEEKIEKALQDRPDIIESQLDIDSRRIARQEARNQRLPRLDLQAEGALRSFGGDVGKSISDLPDASGYQWGVGLRFEYPLGNRAARNTMQRRQFELQQAMVGQESLKLNIVREIRQAIRGIETGMKRVEVTRSASKLAQTQLEAEQEKFRLGLSTSFRVLEFQRELTDARSAETLALSDYNVELARLDQRTGTLRYVDREEAIPSADQYKPSLELSGRRVSISNRAKSGGTNSAAHLSRPSMDNSTKRHMAYAIQVGAFLDESRARLAVSELRNKGYDPYIVMERDTRNRLWRKVCFGKFEDKGRAREMEAMYKAAENQDAYIILTEMMPTPTQ